MRTLVADDEPLARERLRLLLEDEADTEIVGEARNGREALDLLERAEVELLLLDIQMPGADGFAVLAEMAERGRAPAVIFVTAHPEHAVRAFEVQAVDYLVKPVERERLGLAVRRARAWLAHEDRDGQQQRMAKALRVLEEAARAETYPQRFLVKTGNADAVVPVDEIEWIEAADYYVCLHVRDRQHLLRESIKDMEQRLDPRKFVRLHRSAIVNIHHVREVHREGRQEGWVRLASGERVRMNQRGWQRLASMPGVG